MALAFYELIYLASAYSVYCIALHRVGIASYVAFVILRQGIVNKIGKGKSVYSFRGDIFIEYTYISRQQNYFAYGLDVDVMHEKSTQKDLFDSFILKPSTIALPR
jgi:hypothetical protein